MEREDGAGLYGMGPGCPVHGDEHMRECSMCGAEFCKICFPKSSVCPDCADQDEDEDEDEEADPFLDEEIPGDEEDEESDEEPGEDEDRRY